MARRFIFKITLKGVAKPPVWRRLDVPASLTFKKFSDAILDSMGWGGGHLWHFCDSPYELPYIAIPREDDSDEVFDATIDARALTLDSVFEKVGQKQCYTYDFGDDWRHEVRLEEIAEGAESGCVVVASKGKCPPEDCGGAWGYEDLKKTLLAPKAREHKEILKWLCIDEASDWDPKEPNSRPGDVVGEEDYDACADNIIPFPATF